MVSIKMGIKNILKQYIYEGANPNAHDGSYYHYIAGSKTLRETLDEFCKEKCKERDCYFYGSEMLITPDEKYMFINISWEVLDIEENIMYIVKRDSHYDWDKGESANDVQ